MRPRPPASTRPRWWRACSPPPGARAHEPRVPEAPQSAPPPRHGRPPGRPPLPRPPAGRGHRDRGAQRLRARRRPPSPRLECRRPPRYAPRAPFHRRARGGRAPARRRKRRYEVLLPHVIGAGELDPGREFTRGVLTDVETGATRPVVLTPAARARYRELLAEHLGALAALAERTRAVYARLTTEASVRE